MEAITVMKGIYISEKAKARVEKLMQEATKWISTLN
jgi:hypothetical protein